MPSFRPLLAALALCLPSAALADEPIDTVRVLMEMATHNSSDPADGKFVQEDYFSANMLLRFFSKDFNEAYGQAFLRANAGRNELMLDWDPIIGGQDSCPLQDIVYGKPREKAGVITLTVKYNASHCFGEGAGRVADVTFTLVREELTPGSPLFLIDDIAHPGEESLKTTLAAIGK